MAYNQHLESFPAGVALTAPPRRMGGETHCGTPAVYRTPASAERLLELAGDEQPKGGEGAQVATLLLQKLARDLPGDDESAAEALVVRTAFLRHRFMSPLAGYRFADHFYSYLDTILNLASIAAGIGASLLAASESAKGWTIVLGVAIAACQTFSQWLKPSRRAACRSRAAAELRNEAWDMLQGQDRYRDKDVNRSWDVFCNQVNKIVERQRSLEDNESRAASTATFYTNSRGGESGGG